MVKKRKFSVSGIPNPHDLAFTSAVSDVRVEQQSISDYWMPLRLLRYLCRILDQHRKQHSTTLRLPLVVPLIFYTIKAVWAPVPG